MRACFHSYWRAFGVACGARLLACYLSGTLITACAESLGALLLGQFVVGVGVAVSVASNIAYVTEMVPGDRSGAMVALYELATTFGSLASA